MVISEVIIPFSISTLTIVFFLSLFNNSAISASEVVQDKTNLSDLSTKFQNLLTDEEQSYINNSKPLTVCSVAQAAGSDASISITKLAADHTGLTFQASPALSWQNALNALQNKECDILPWATKTTERLKVMNFTAPYAYITRVIVTNRQQAFITDISDYEEQTFVIEKGNIINKLLKERYPKIQLLTVDKASDTLDMVADGKAFASISSLYTVNNIINHRLLSELKISGQLLSDFDDKTAFATRRDDKILNNILNKAVLTSDKQAIRNFISKGAEFTYETGVDYSIVWKLTLVGLLLFSVLVWWNRHLSDINKKLEKAHDELAYKSQQLQVLSITDSLTQTYNRSKLDSLLNDELERSIRYQHPFSLIMIDIDYFKQVNDKFGHLAGDKVLIQFATILQKNIRSNDYLGRWGGEEFLIICSNTSMDEALMVAEKLRVCIETASFQSVHSLTASFGVTSWKQNDDRVLIIKRADEALYISKESGRNCVTKLS